ESSQARRVLTCSRHHQSRQGQGISATLARSAFMMRVTVTTAKPVMLRFASMRVTAFTIHRLVTAMQSFYGIHAVCPPESDTPVGGGGISAAVFAVFAVFVPGSVGAESTGLVLSSPSCRCSADAAVDDCA